MATVSVEFTAFMDPRYRILADLSKQTRFDAIGRMAAIWAYCIDKNQSVLAESFIDAMAEMKGFSVWMVEADLAVRTEDGMIRVKGTEGRIEYLAKARERQKKATEAATRKRLETTNPILSPTSDPKLDPALVSSSASSSTSSSALKEEIHIDRRKHRSRAVKSVFDLEAAYEIYPRKVGKTKGLQKLAKEIQSQEDYDALLVAIRHYSNSREVREGYVRYFSNFATDWRDWIDPETGSTQAPMNSVNGSVPLSEVTPV